jgi:oligosaccharyltransferase complex subunit beta
MRTSSPSPRFLSLNGGAFFCLPRAAPAAHSHTCARGDSPNAYVYRIKDEIKWSMVIEEFDQDAGGWRPYKANDVQVEFVMLNPYERRTLTHDGKGNFSAIIHVPDQYGVFTFRVKYTRPGMSNLLILEQANVRAFRHDEYERFIPAAFPYYSAAIAYMASFFIFSVSFLMTPLSSSSSSSSAR